MTIQQTNPRVTEADVDCQYIDRWSPRAFLPDSVPDWQVMALFEAARWSPSCYNEQPWVFRYAVSAAGRARLASALVTKNQAWASKAPLLIFVLAQTTFNHNRTPNRHAAFDAGAAWMSLAFQARRFGLYAHAMAGFDEAKAREALGVGSDYLVLAAIAVGRRGDPGTLPADLRSMEAPNERKSLKDVAIAID